MRMCSAGVPGFEKHCFRAYYAIRLRQERYAKDKWTTVLKLFRVTARWGGKENVFTMNITKLKLKLSVGS